MGAKTLRYRYRVDAADVLEWVDPLWLAFAQENGAPQLNEAAVLGRPLWDFVNGRDVQSLYQAIHQRVRTQGRPVILPFRCDSPTLQRHMRLTITLQPADRLAYESQLIRVVPQRALPILDVDQRRSASVLTICSCCKKALLEPLGWLDIEDVTVRLGLFEMVQLPELRHTVCPECAATLKIAADASGAAERRRRPVKGSSRNNDASRQES